MRRLLPWLALTYAQEKPYYEVVFAVLTVPQHRPHRDAIRNGYGQPGGFRTKLWFVVSEKDPGFAGAGFVEERSQRDDLLVCDTAPGFDHIIGKVSCAIRKAVHLYDFDFFFKTDDDATLSEMATASRAGSGRSYGSWSPRRTHHLEELVSSRSGLKEMIC